MWKRVDFIWCISIIYGIIICWSVKCRPVIDLMMEQSKIGVRQNDSVLIAGFNDTSIICWTRWTTDVADTALKIYKKKKIIRIALDALPFCFLQKYSIPILHDQYYLWMGKMRPMPKQHPSIWWPIVYDHRWLKIRVLHRIVIGIELMANLYQPYPKHNCQWHLKCRHVLYRLWISMIKHVDDVVTTNCPLYRQPNVCSGYVIVDRLQCQWLDHHVHNIPNYCIENKLYRLEHVFKTRSINLLCSVTFECISKQL